MADKRKLTVEEVAQIRAQRKAGALPSEIAKKFGITRQAVWYIVSYWRHKKSC